MSETTEEKTTPEITTPEVAPPVEPTTPEAPSEPVGAVEPVSAKSQDTATKGYKSFKSKGAAPEAAAPVFTPDWKYKFNGQEKEVDAFFRPLVKDAQALEKVKDIIQRAEAVEIHKQKSKQYETELSEYKPTVETVSKLREMYEKGDHERVLSNIGYTDEMLYKIVQEKLSRQQMSPEQKAVWEKEQKLALENEELLKQNEVYRSQAQQELANLTGYQLEAELGKADYQGMKEMYEKANGSGSFRQLVIDRGAYLVDRAGKHVPPSEVMASVAKEFAPFINQVPAGAAPVTAQQKPKVIPNVGRSGGSPTRSAITSLDQLKQLQKQFQ
jgi:hypothetical protein